MVIKRDLAETIEDHALFAGLERSYLDLIVGCASDVRFQAGEYLFREGDQADTFYVVRQGRVAVEVLVPQRGAIAVQTIGEGEVLSWSWLIPPYTAQFDARCVESTRAIAFDGTCLRAKCELDHDLGYALMKRFARIMVARSRALRMQLLDLCGTVRTP